MDTERKGLWLGLAGVVIFAMTTPMTRLAVGPVADPQLQPAFVTAGRAAFAAVLSLAYLLVTRAPWPERRHLGPLLLSAAGTVVGFPLFLSLALREVNAMHASVVTGLLPLATAVVAAHAWRQRPSNGFWACAMAGFALVLGYALHEGGGVQRGGMQLADALLLLAVLSGAVGYVAGAKLSTEWPAEQVICWVLVISLPLSWPLAWATWPAQPVRTSAWWGFGYVTLFSMWVGFFAWYRGLVMGGTVRVSQVQLVQPFLSLLFAVPVLGERLNAATLLFSLAVIATVFIGRRMPTDTASAHIPPRPFPPMELPAKPRTGPRP
jgi:drug/metabolite transporter (DMT)-like permease